MNQRLFQIVNMSNNQLHREVPTLMVHTRFRSLTTVVRKNREGLEVIEVQVEIEIRMVTTLQYLIKDLMIKADQSQQIRTLSPPLKVKAVKMT